MSKLGARLLALGALVTLLTAAHAQTHARWSLHPGANSNEVVLHADLDSGWHLYSTVPVKGEGPVPTTITVKPPMKLAGAVQESKPITKLDPNFNLVVQFFQNTADFTVPLATPVAKGADAVTVRFQLCNDSTCIPPSSVTVTEAGTVVPATASPTGKPAASYSDTVKNAKSDGLVPFVALSFGAGLLSLLTPCVFPMIPITVSFFSKRRGAQDKKVGYREAFLFCAGIISTFAVFGIVVSLIFGASGIQRFATNPWVNLALAGLFIVLALSLLGIYSVNLPPRLVNAFTGAQGKAGWVAPALMGLTFTLTSFTCTVPFVGTILAGAAQGDLLYPIVGMLAYGTAFSLPFFVLALFPQYLARLPKSGSWLETVKAFMGFIEVAAALKFVSNADLVLQTNLLKRPVFLAIWVIIALAAGLFLLGVLPLPKMEKQSGISKVRALVGIASIALAAWLASGLGGRSLGELEAFMPPTDSGWIHDYKTALALAQKEGRPVLINFTGVTCTNCRWMERNMFPRKEVQAALGKFVTVELYTDREQTADQMNKQLEQDLTQTVTLPEYVLVSPDGKKFGDFAGSTRDQTKFVGFLSQHA